MHINAAHKFFTKTYGVIPGDVHPGQKIIVQKHRIYFIDEDTQIDDKMILLEGFTEVFPQHEANKPLFEKTETGLLLINSMMK